MQLIVVVAARHSQPSHIAWSDPRCYSDYPAVRQSDDDRPVTPVRSCQKNAYRINSAVGWVWFTRRRSQVRGSYSSLVRTYPAGPRLIGLSFNRSSQNGNRFIHLGHAVLHYGTTVGFCKHGTCRYQKRGSLKAGSS
jgi:hypothetical protein